MKRGLLIAVVAVAGLLVFTGCEKNETKPTIIGSWSTTYAGSKYTYTFNEDKTCSYDAAGTKMECTYELKEDNKISILYKGNTAPFETTYELTDKTLNVKDSFGNDTIYNKD